MLIVSFLSSLDHSLRLARGSSHETAEMFQPELDSPPELPSQFGWDVFVNDVSWYGRQAEVFNDKSLFQRVKHSML
jgi:hypothetical protein